MDIEESVAEQLLRHAEQQTRALRGLYNMGWAWSALAAIGLLVWLVVAVANR